MYTCYIVHSWEHLEDFADLLADSSLDTDATADSDASLFSEQAAVVLQAFIDEELGGWANSFGWSRD